MALTGLQIRKLLPNTNCKECGSNTCLAFAMKLAGKKAQLSECPYASDEAKQVLGAAAEPPVKAVALGAEKSLKMGEETVLYRHEKTFVSPTALAVNVNATDAPDVVDAALKNIRDYVLERVGETMGVDLVAVSQNGASDDDFLALAQKARDVGGKPLVLRADTPEALKKGAESLKGAGALLFAATPDSADELAAVAKDNGHALAVTAPDVGALAQTTARLKDGGFNELVLAFETFSPAEAFQTSAIARRAALKDDFKALGYPFARFLTSTTPAALTAEATREICKYGGLVVLPTFDAALLSTLFTMRLNIFTDPQKPIQVEPKVYAVGEPGPESPVFVTTNFSLTYFLVSGEIENSGVSAWLLVPECDGMSVLTAWAAGKFSGESVAEFVKKSDLADKLSTKRIIIPGYVAVIMGELEDGLPDWEVLVGPQEAGDLEGFVKARL